MLADSKSTPSAEWIRDLRIRYPTEQYVDVALTRKLNKRSGLPHRIATVESVIDRLERFLEKRIAKPFKLSDVRALIGGSSKEQFSFQLETVTSDGEKKSERMVLRLQPSESIVETHRLREFQVMKALKGTIPVPDVHWLDEDGTELGQPALISSFCEGVARPPSEGLITGPTGGFGARFRGLLAPQFVRYLAALGTFDWSRADLGSLDKPKVGSNEAVIWAINWWQRVWEEDALESVPMMTAAAHWLRENAPPVDRISLVHADYKGRQFPFFAGHGPLYRDSRLGTRALGRSTRGLGAGARSAVWGARR